MCVGGNRRWVPLYIWGKADSKVLVLSKARLNV